MVRFFRIYRVTLSLSINIISNYWSLLIISGIHWRTIRDNYVFLKDNLITHTTLIDELLACDVFSDEDKADYKKVNNIKCGKLIKEILRKGSEACRKFLEIIQSNRDYGCPGRLGHGSSRKFWKKNLESKLSLISSVFQQNSLGYHIGWGNWRKTSFSRTKMPVHKNLASLLRVIRFKLVQTSTP